jgi:hypothetical protein
VAVLDAPNPPGTGTAASTAVTDYLQRGGVSGATVTINPTEPTTAVYGAPVTVTVQVPYSSVSWIPTPTFLTGNTNLRAVTVMRRETVQ